MNRITVLLVLVFALGALNLVLANDDLPMSAAADVLSASVELPPTEVISAANAGRMAVIAQLDHSNREEIVLGVQPTPHFAPQGIVEGVTFSPDGRYVLHRTAHGIVWVVDLSSGSERAILVSNTETARFSPDWQTLVVTNAEHDQRYLKLWNTERLLPTPFEAQGPCQIEPTLPTVGVRTLPYPDAPALGVAEQGDVLTGIATSTVEGWVMVQTPQGTGWTDARLGRQDGDCANLPVLLLPGTERLTIDTYFWTRDLFFSADSELLITPIYYGLLVWEARTGELLQHYRGDITSFNRDRTRFFSSRSQVVDLQTGDVLTDVGGYQQGPASFSVDGRWFATHFHDGTIQLENLTDSTHGPRVTPAFADLLTMTFSPDSRWFAVLSVDGQYGATAVTQVWDTQTGAEAAQVVTDRTASLAFSPDSQRLLTSEGNQTLWLELSSGQRSGLEFPNYRRDIPSAGHT